MRGSLLDGEPRLRPGFCALGGDRRGALSNPLDHLAGHIEREGDAIWPYRVGIGERSRHIRNAAEYTK